MVTLRKSGWMLLCCLFSMALQAAAGGFDGSTPLSGTVDKVLEVSRTRVNHDADPDTVGLPRKFIIDFEHRTLRPSNDSLIRRTSKIKRVEHIENKLVLQGVEDGVENVDDGLAWSLVISKKTGHAVLSAAGDGVAYVVFGQCAVAEHVQNSPP